MMVDSSGNEIWFNLPKWMEKTEAALVCEPYKKKRNRKNKSSY